MLDALSIMAFAFLLEFINNSMGGGYGTLGGPVLLMFGYTPQSVVPALLFSETVSEYWGGAWHVRFKNVDFRVFSITLLGSIVGIVAATFMLGVYLPAAVARLYIGVLAVIMGIFAIVMSFRSTEKRSDYHNPAFWKVVLLGGVCGFNKSSTGGGYGPISTSGYMLLGMMPANAVATTIFAKATSCLIAILLYAGLSGGIDWTLTTFMSVGAFVAAPISSWLNNYLKLSIKPRFHGRLIGIVMTLLGTYALLRQLGTR